MLQSRLKRALCDPPSDSAPFHELELRSVFSRGDPRRSPGGLGAAWLVLVQRTGIQQHADGVGVIGQRGVVEGGATAEAGSAAEPAAELVLPGHEDCRDTRRGREKESQAEEEK